MDRFLSLFRKEPATTPPSLLVQEDSPVQSPIANLGKRIINKYFDKLSQFQLNLAHVHLSKPGTYCRLQ